MSEKLSELELAEKLMDARNAGVREASEYRLKELSNCISQSGASWGVADWDDVRDFINFAGKAFAESQRAARAEARPAPVVDREAVARIVDPIAFKCWQATYDYGRRIGDSELEALETAEWAHGKSRDEALAKADAILALLPPATSPGEGKAEVLAENILALSKGYPQDEINFYRSRNAGIWRREVQSARAILAAMAAPSRDNAGGGG